MNDNEETILRTERKKHKKNTTRSYLFEENHKQDSKIEAVFHEIQIDVSAVGHRPLCPKPFERKSWQV
jgi:hypothetical protein